MRAVEWQAWLERLPHTRAQLQEVQAELQQQAVATEARFRAAVWQGDKPAERAARIQLNVLNSQLRLIHSRVQAA